MVKVSRREVNNEHTKAYTQQSAGMIRSSRLAGGGRGLLSGSRRERQTTIANIITEDTNRSQQK